MDRTQTMRLKLLIRKRRKIMIFIAIVSGSLLVIYNMKLDHHTDKAKKTSCKGTDCATHSPVDYSSITSNLLLVLIYSSIDGSDRREVIRSTWTSMLDNSPGSSVHYRFVLGGSNVTLEQLRLEANKYGDMLILDDVTNDYYALTNRTISVMKYITKHNYKFSYLLKCDDDTFVDLQQVCTELQNRNSHTKLYWGRFIKWSVMTEGKHKETQWTTADDYLPYCYGGGYIISKDLVNILAQNEPFLKRYNSEDVSVGAWLAPYNMERKHDARFNTAIGMRKTCSNTFLVIHQVKRKPEMYSYYKALMGEGVVCGRGSMHWVSELIAHSTMYVYDWTAKPSQCCKHGVIFS